MVDSLIRRYKLYRKNVTYEDLHADTLSFLSTKVHKFDVTSGKKAYSYFGTICKHYLLGLLIKDEKYINLNSSYEDLRGSLENDETLSYEIIDEKKTHNKALVSLMEKVSNQIEDEILSNDCKLNDNEIKIGYALIDILRNWNDIFGDMEGGIKFNKNSVYSTIRNYGNLSTKEVRNGLKKFKAIYFLTKNDALNSGFL